MRERFLRHLNQIYDVHKKVLCLTSAQKSHMAVLKKELDDLVEKGDTVERSYQEAESASKNDLGVDEKAMINKQTESALNGFEQFIQTADRLLTDYRQLTGDMVSWFWKWIEQYIVRLTFSFGSSGAIISLQFPLVRAGTEASTIWTYAWHKLLCNILNKRRNG